MITREIAQSILDRLEKHFENNFDGISSTILKSDKLVLEKFENQFQLDNDAPDSEIEFSLNVRVCIEAIEEELEIRAE